MDWLENLPLVPASELQETAHLGCFIWYQSLKQAQCKHYSTQVAFWAMEPQM
ncbi:hypothetical protein GLAREA_06119 [Glarea lozoyensis ATCC 20868]|uniref:Uncharacterized protein n=1 Tax=Glarea lozoyensis (strain ATCC 20868 / MF5171) TaxID=1116229 RepID=S3D3Q0_GLAL2|nr:uncharacterized protein GLAREA_06119 [Glarea lozoyensis ATCC 20868]EPE33107.1 hypothetical protein GLAREA_06119 [Glarea lozoyensis ATCC 20868]